ncbi:hypothetical protein JKF63_01144 [Porcisia hertigi]|uniref:Uncharacterized protein n=1 Tax=Porcisia hertigi TaxID=2761500 RepID=A0A836ICD7_9TRYP|nr:hypothetical protein JKF63_01144 [Porcisia hertigi]
MSLRQSARRWQSAYKAFERPFRSISAVTPAHHPLSAKKSGLSSSTHMWESVVSAFYDEFVLYTQHRSNEVRLTQTAEVAMLRCLSEKRPNEALEVYEAVCRCGLIGMSSRTLSRCSCRTLSNKTPVHTGTSQAFVSLDQLAQRALTHVPHRKSMHAMLALLMAAELEAAPLPTTDYGYARMMTRSAHRNRDLEASSNNAYVTPAETADGRGTLAEPALLPPIGTLSAAEQARIRIQQHLYTLHATQQLCQPLGKECCLVEMHQLCAPSSVNLCASKKTMHTAGDVEVGPLYTLSHVILHHPFTFIQPSAPWAQREMHWEDIGSRVCVQALAPADVARLTKIEETVRPYRLLCKDSLTFLSRMVPNWDTVLVRRVAETLVIPAAAHGVFPDSYRRLRSAAAQSRRSSVGATLSRPGRARVQITTPECCTSWTDAATHRLFGEESGDGHASPLSRVEHIIKRRVHHDVVVPDTPYILQRFQQLKHLSRHREVIVTHSVFLDLVAAASLSTHPTRFHARRVLREVMCATTTAVTGRVYDKTGSTFDVQDSVSASLRQQQQLSGFTLLGLQDELALLERCPERFYLSAFPSAASLSDQALMGKRTSLDRATYLGDIEPGSYLSVVLVAKQLERMIAAHDNGEDFFASDTAAAPTSTHAKINNLVQQILEGNSSASNPTKPFSQQPSGPLFRNRSHGLWARLPIVIATTQDNTRMGAFTVGLNMYPPAGVVP